MSRAVLALAAVAIAMRPVHADEFLVRHAARAVAAGEVLALEVITPPDVTTVTSSWQDRTVPFVKVAAGRWNALIGIDVEETPGPRSVRSSRAARTAPSWPPCTRSRSSRRRGGRAG